MICRSVVRCRGCGAVASAEDRYQWSCPNRVVDDDVDHVMVREMDPGAMSVVTSDSENPFIRYRGRLHAYQRWMAAGRADGEFVELVEELDAAVAAVDGRGFRRTPLRRFPGLDAIAAARVWVKDETGNVAGSHKGRHLFGLMVVMTVAERLGLIPGGPRAPLAIASCGNAALAAATIAAATGRRLLVFIPAGAGPAVVERLTALGADLRVCSRAPALLGDPCYRAFVAAVDAGALPFGCQGSDNGLTIEGGATLAWELADASAEKGVDFERLVVQVGGGALASACIQGMAEAVAVGTVARMPAIDTVQSVGAFPLARAHAAVLARMAGGATVDEALRHASRHRRQYMWSWETVPAGVADAILDDETYDWLAVVAGMLRTGGSPVVVDEPTLIEANRLARLVTGIDVDITGSAGLAALLTTAGAGPNRAEAADRGAGRRPDGPAGAHQGAGGGPGGSATAGGAGSATAGGAGQGGGSATAGGAGQGAKIGPPEPRSDVAVIFSGGRRAGR